MIRSAFKGSFTAFSAKGYTMESKKIVVGVVADTHIPRKGKVLPEALIAAFRQVDLIVHAGDINRDYVIYELEELAPVEAVAGNTDDDGMRQQLGTKKIITLGDKRIGVIHGDGERGTTFERVKKAFEKDAVDCVIFGHSHIPMNEVVEGVLYFNPGSPTDKRRQPRYSCGLLTVEDEHIYGSLVYW